MARRDSRLPVQDFCADLRDLCDRAPGLDRRALAHRLGYSRSQLYAILDGNITRPPDWSRVVEPLVRYAGGTERDLANWRRRHEVLIRVHEEMRRISRSSDQPRHEAMSVVIPAQLPADVPNFAGRVNELASLDAALVISRHSDDTNSPLAVLISAVSGTAGVGKTALAVRWGHRVRASFPDGQIYLNLRGYDSEQPVSPTDAIASLLMSLGLSGKEIPLELYDRAALYRSLVNRRRILIVLDNASSTEQVRHLIPGSATSFVVITSRDSLTSLVALYGAKRIDLDLLPHEDATNLLAELIGQRAINEPVALATLAEQCARLPLALRLAGELVISRPSASLASLVDELVDEQRRLDLLDAGGDSHAAVRAVFSWSYRDLPVAAARSFRLLGLHPGPHFDLYAAAALVGCAPRQTEGSLSILARNHLLSQTTSHDRFLMHDLLHAYAFGLSTEEETQASRDDALSRLLEYYLATAALAADTLFPADRGRRPRAPSPDIELPDLTTSVRAREWLDTERATLVAVTKFAARHNRQGYADLFSRFLYRYLNISGSYVDAIAIHTEALTAARQSGNQDAEGYALTNLGLVYWRQDRYAAAADCHRQAQALFAGNQNQHGEARALNNLGLVCWRQGLYSEAFGYHMRAQQLFQALQDRVGEAPVLDNLGLILFRQGYYDKAADYYSRAQGIFHGIEDAYGEAYALDHLGLVRQRQGRYEEAAVLHDGARVLFRGIGNRDGEADTLDHLGLVLSCQGDYEAATDHHRRAEAILREVGDRAGQADVLDHLGAACARQRLFGDAASCHRSAIDLYREVGDRGGEARALNGLGEAERSLGNSQDAIVLHTLALSLSSETGDRYERARSHLGIGDAYASSGDAPAAMSNWNKALSILSELNIPDIEAVRARLKLRLATRGCRCRNRAMVIHRPALSCPNVAIPMPLTR